MNKDNLILLKNKKEEKEDTEKIFLFLDEMVHLLKNEITRKITSVAVIAYYDEVREENTQDFSLSAYNFPLDTLVLTLEKIKYKLISEDVDFIK